jgi:CubicO group peptidase (beta-lactamase class C family)
MTSSPITKSESSSSSAPDANESLTGRIREDRQPHSRQHASAQHLAVAIDRVDGRERLRCLPKLVRVPRMRALLFTGILGLVVSCASASPAPSPQPSVAPSSAFDAKTVEAIIARAMKASPVPGVAVAIVRDGEVLFSRGFGIRKLGASDAVDGDTLFSIASLTKAFTATAAALVVEDQKVSWDAPVIQYLPSFALSDPIATQHATLRDLLSHRSGLPLWGGDLLWWGSRYDRAEVLRRSARVPMAFAFRAGYGYSNIAYQWAGEVISAKSGLPWDRFVRERLLTPLRMNRTTTSYTEAQTRDNRALPHTNVDGKGLRLADDRLLDVEQVNAAAGMFSSTNDLARWMLFQLGRGELDAQRVAPLAAMDTTWTAHAFAPVSVKAKEDFPELQFNEYALGWFRSNHRRKLVVRHGGALTGSLSTLLLLPDERLGVVVLTNADLPLHQHLAWSLVDAALGLPDAGLLKKLEKPDPPPTFTPTTEIPRSEHGAYVGSYTSDLYGELVIQASAAGLEVNLGAHPGVSCPLTKAAEDVLRCPWSMVDLGVSDLTFSTAKSGARTFEVRFAPDWIDTVEYTFTRQEPRRVR